ncbi:hypothetical protein [Marinifilum caeruleilacunae]|uniref:Uncharacterized protein n=1 Tax=Marinifilum caeruleilacunae TaxID=2499076 RepID=A0ABX1WZK3_9BACT|nr:hypothetical protein [Marinifilum caeruleilacunae]NOU61265.1 hypothetical protein [Marinifilum caeruleilacunae]
MKKLKEYLIFIFIFFSIQAVCYISIDFIFYDIVDFNKILRVSGITSFILLTAKILGFLDK